MQNPFAVAVQWPDDARCYIVHLRRPYFTAAVCESSNAVWLLVSWMPSARTEEINRPALFRAAADFCRKNLDRIDVPIQFVERKHGHHLPPFLMAQSPRKELFIVEPEHCAPLVEVRENAENAQPEKSNLSQRFDVVTQWRLAQMRKYYQRYLERQKALGVIHKAFASV